MDQARPRDAKWRRETTTRQQIGRPAPHLTPSGGGHAPTPDRSESSAAGSALKRVDNRGPVTEEAVRDLWVSPHIGGVIRKAYPSDVSDEEWALVAPYLALLPEDAGQRRYALRESFNGLRYIVKTGAPWRWMPNDLPPWELVYQQTQRWLAAGCFEALVHDVRVLLRLERGRRAEPTAVVIDSRTLQSTPESGHRAGWDGAKRRKGSKVHAVVDTLGHLLALNVTPANEGDRTEVAALAEAVQDITAQ